MEFIDRREELKELERLHKIAGAKMVLVYGRRRVGKTRLLQEFTRGKQAIFYTADARTEPDQLEEFGARVAEYLGPQAALARFGSWADSLSYLMDELSRQRRKVVLILDEFPEITRQNHAVPSSLRAIWDRVESESSVMLILSGSLVGEMERLAQGKEPLYGRFRGSGLRHLPSWEGCPPTFR
jgi:AAA+ ATPase superfamily predicted ATPase